MAPRRIGLISDTHGLLRPQALAFLRGCDQIIHGGDIGGPEILDELSAIAPVTAVRGNNDSARWARALPLSARVAFAGGEILVIHDLNTLRKSANTAAVRAVVSGHSHQPSQSSRDGVLYVNPGSAGPRRFRLPAAVAELIIVGRSVKARLVQLDI
jgi:uncharacterized protein